MTLVIGNLRSHSGRSVSSKNLYHVKAMIASSERLLLRGSFWEKKITKDDDDDDNKVYRKRKGLIGNLM